MDHWGYKKEERPDFVEVTRCRDCEHWETEIDVDRDKAENGLCYAFKFSLFTTPWNGYCFKGDKRK